MRRGNPDTGLRTIRRDRPGVLLLLAFGVLCSAQLPAAGVTGQVADNAGLPVEDAVISLTPRDAVSSAAAVTAPAAVMDQWGKQFTPYVLPVRVGTRVSFPNRDNIKHHVYSFSPAKRFELKLYSSGTAQPVLFDKPGIVALGCNIHDWMIAYIDVLATPYFAKTDAQGHAGIDALPDGVYHVEVWHPRLRGSVTDFSRDITLSGAKPVALQFTLPLKREQHRAPPRYYEGGGY
jgi:plastocyanin